MAIAQRTVREGLTVGFIGTVAVAAFYAAFDLFAARGFLFTVNLLGRVVFDGLRDPSVLVGPVVIHPTAVVLYSLLHLIVALAIGLVVAWLVIQMEGPPAQARLAALLLAAGFLVTVFGIGMASAPMRDVLPWWSVVVANLLSVLIGGTYLLRLHPGLFQRLTLIAP